MKSKSFFRRDDHLRRPRGISAPQSLPKQTFEYEFFLIMNVLLYIHYMYMSHSFIQLTLFTVPSTMHALPSYS